MGLQVTTSVVVELCVTERNSKSTNQNCCNHDDDGNTPTNYNVNDQGLPPIGESHEVHPECDSLLE